MYRIGRMIGDYASLRLPQHRLVVFGLLSSVVFVMPYQWMDTHHYTVWSFLGLTKVPSTGLTRAYWQLLHGHPVAAWHRNGLIYIILTVLTAVLIKDMLALKRKQNALAI